MKKRREDPWTSKWATKSQNENSNFGKPCYLFYKTKPPPAPPNQKQIISHSIHGTIVYLPTYHKNLTIHVGKYTIVP